MEIEYIIVIIVLLIIILFNTYRISCLEKELQKGMIEGFDNSELSNEALRNIASVYNKDELTVTNLKVTGNLDVTGNSTVGGTSTLKNTNVTGNLGVTGKVTGGSGKLGQYEIRNDRIGIPGRADIQIHSDKWCRLKAYNSDAYAGSPGWGGFAGKHLWTERNSINNRTPLYRNDTVALKHTSGGHTNQMNHPWVHVDTHKNIVKWYQNASYFQLV